MSLQSLKEYIDLREKYINLFVILNQNDVPMDVKNYILGFAKKIKIDNYHDFDKSLKLMAENFNITLTPDALHLLNYILISLIKDITRNAFLVTEYRRAKRLAESDIEYALDIYPRKNSTLVSSMLEAGADVIERLLEQKYTKNKMTKKQVVNTYLDYNVVKKWMNEYFRPMNEKIKKANRKYSWDTEDVQIQANAHIYLSAALDVFIETILSTTKGVVTADDVLKACQPIEIKSILLELFPLQ